MLLVQFVFIHEHRGRAWDLTRALRDWRPPSDTDAVKVLAASKRGPYVRWGIWSIPVDPHRVSQFSNGRLLNLIQVPNRQFRFLNLTINTRWRLEVWLGIEVLFVTYLHLQLLFVLELSVQYRILSPKESWLRFFENYCVLSILHELRSCHFLPFT